MEEIFQVATSLDVSRTVWLGPGLYSAILRYQKDNIQDVSSFIRAVKVTFNWIMEIILH